MAESIIGKDCKVANGSNKIIGMGTYSLPIGTIAEHDDSEFGDDWMKRKYGMRDGGTITFSGKFKKADATGQDVIEKAFIDNTELTDLRFYIDNTSYYAPCRTTGYFSPSYTTGAPTQLSHVVITSSNVGSDKSGLMTREFQAQVSGCMVLV